MFARINIPGSKHHRFFYGTKKECQEWIEKQTINASCQSDYYPSSLLTDKEAFKVKYLDGNRVYYFQPNHFSSYTPKCDEIGEMIY